MSVIFDIYFCVVQGAQHTVASRPKCVDFDTKVAFVRRLCWIAVYFSLKLYIAQKLIFVSVKCRQL